MTVVCYHKSQSQ
jgi:hypothetical protein